MKAEKIAKAYACALIELCNEKNKNLISEITYFSEMINKVTELENVLFLDVFTLEEKLIVLNEVMIKLSLSDVAKDFLEFLVVEKRLGMFPQIFKELIVIEDDKKGFLKGNIESSDTEIDQKDLNMIKDYLKSKLNKEIELTHIKSEKFSTGYRVTVGDLQLDATLENQLEKLKIELLNQDNEY
jgi:F-type H+-transporting ATPase subunit delta